jgi:hypothetical protein
MPSYPNDERRREFLIRLLASGLLSVPLLRAQTAQAGAAAPGPLPPGRSIYRLQGEVRVNGTAATLSTVIQPGDRVETGADGLVIFVVGKDAFILRAGSTLELAAGTGGGEAETASASVGRLRVLTGALLSVFGRSEHAVETPVASIGIRGTGLYVESQPGEAYVCTCYGTADIVAIGDPGSRETVVSTHHNAPRYITAGEPAGRAIAPAPFKNHDDEELLLIESLVGRTTPFIVPSRSPLRRRRY